MHDMTTCTKVAIDILFCRSVSAASGAHAREGDFRFNWYNTIDCAPAISPLPHKSGRKYKYCQQYVIKTQSCMVKHEPPDVFKQFTWKPWTKLPDLPEEPVSPPKRKVSAKKTPPKLVHMEKKDLVKELQWQHLTWFLDVGTVNANTTQALAKELLLLTY